MLVPVPTVDKAKLESYNLLAVVLEITKDGTQYRLGTRSDLLDGFYHRNQFQVTLVNFLSKDEVPMNINLSARTAAIKDSIGRGIGFLRCSCTGKCLTRQCSCVKEGAKCNSRCHGGSLRTCKNRDD